MAIMNVYSGDVFWNNLHFLGSYHFDSDNDLAMDLRRDLPERTRSDLEPFAPASPRCRLSRRPAVRADQGRLRHQPRECAHRVRHDGAKARHARYLRQELAAGDRSRQHRPWSRGDPGWPNGALVGVEAAGAEGVPLQSLPREHHPDHYCTEKIWHAIIAGCLPIYHGAGTRIYDTFAAGSFIHHADFKSPDEMLDAVAAMPLERYLERLNACIRVYNKARVEKLDLNVSSELPLDCEERNPTSVGIRAHRLTRTTRRFDLSAALSARSSVRLRR